LCARLELSADDVNHKSRSVLLTAQTLQLRWNPPVDGLKTEFPWIDQGGFGLRGQKVIPYRSSTGDPIVKSNQPTRRAKSALEKRASRKLTNRGRLFETLERRELMASDFSPQVVSALAKMRFQDMEAYERAGVTLTNLFRGTGGTGGTAGGEANNPINLSEVEPNNIFSRAQLLPLSSSQPVNLSGTFANVSDVDYIAFDLKKGDILDTRLVAVTGSRPTVGLYDAAGNELLFTEGVFLGGRAYPATSPLYEDGNVTLPYVIDTDGRYYMRISDGIGGYSMNLRVHRSTFEQEPIGTQQIIYLDFDGSFMRRETFPGVFTLPTGTVRVPSLARAMPLIGLTEADAPAVIRNIMTRVTNKLQPWLAEESNNGYFPSTGRPGDFGVRLVSSLDSPDIFGNANVSRISVGGTDAELGLAITGLFGVAESVDIGNFNREESALVVAELHATFAADRQAIPISGSVTVADVFSEIIADTIAHEAGHYLGSVHQDPFNETLTMMDQYPPASLIGVGLDGIFGTRDDDPFRFRDDEFSPVDTAYGGGWNNSPDVVAFGMSTGTVGGSITGIVFNDMNRNSRQEAGEVGLAGWQVYADSNNNGLLDLSEARGVTDSLGRYSLKTAAGIQTVRVVRPTGWQASNAAEESKSVTVALSGTATANFGSFSPSGGSTGFKWLDINGDGIKDSSEPGLSGVYIYLDLDQDGRPDVGEPAAITKADGSYVLTPPGPGTYIIREVVDPGYVQTFPSAGSHTAIYNGSTPLGGYDFGNRESSDWGDAPAPYATLRANGGASHGGLAGFNLGANWDADSDGRPTSTANGDDVNGPLNANGNVINDEDGVTILTPLIRGDNQNAIRINVTNTSGSGAFVQGWIDFNGNGVWGDAGEQIVTNLAAVPGENIVNFTIPANAVSSAYARFRLSQSRDLGPNGRANAGEVEDYVFTITNGPRKNLQDDTYTVARNSTANIFDVLSNDFLPPGDPVSAVLPGATAQGGTVSVGANNTLRYTPPRGFFGQDTFIYTVVYASGKRETATVTINVTLQFTDPVAIDDSFDLPTNSVSYPLNVLLNDIEGAGGSLVVTGFTSPDKGGTLSIGSGGLSLRYTPRRDFGGTESFTYTVTDGNGKTSTARVTVHTLEGDRLDDNVEFSFAFRDMSGNPITSVTQGDQFQVYVYNYDLRPERGALQTPPTSVPNPGVYAAYLDLLYSSNLVLPSSPGSGTTLDFANSPVAPYNSGVSGTASVPGVIQSLGAFTGAQKPPFDFANPTLMTVLTFTARSAGLAEFVGDPANDSPNTDVVLYNPPNAPVPTEQVRYLRSSIEVVPRGTELPFAVDDSTAELLVNTTSFIDVLANDIVGTSGPLRITSVTQPNNGVVSIDNRGTTNTSDDRIRFVPFTSTLGFSDQFTYTIADTRGFSSTATVTLKVGDTSADDKMKIQLKAFNLNGQPITSVPVGSQFELRGYVQDLRPATSLSGVFAAYQDILYDSKLVGVQTSQTGLGFSIEFAGGANGYSNGKSGDIRIPGLINEVGSFQDASSPLGTSELLQFAIRMTANTPGVAKFVADPADISPFHDSLLYSDTRNKVPYNQISYIPAELVITGGSGTGGGEGNTNPMNRFDVNNDGFVSPIDALILVNMVNTSGGGNLGGGGEGEGAGDKYYVDVNEDGFLSPLDILWVVNKLNVGPGGEGEGSAAPAIEMTTRSTSNYVDVPFLSVSNWMSQSPSPVSAMSQEQVSNIDSLLAGYAAEDDEDETVGELVDDLFGNAWQA